MKSAPTLTPLVLLVDDQEWTSRSIESTLRPKGYVVLKAYTGKQALDLVQKVSPDAILVNTTLPDLDGIELVRLLRQAPTVHATTPILTLSSIGMGRVERLEAFGAGSWDVLAHPIDSNELILRMDTFVGAKQEADRVRDAGLTDPVTGFYNVRGILQRAREVSADASRSDRPITCIAFGATGLEQAAGQQPDEAGALAEVISRPVAEALRAVTRISDTLGRLGPGEFVVLAPGTDQQGALRLADRVLEAIEADAERGGYGVRADSLSRIRAGFCAVTGSDTTAPEDLLLRATMALRKAQADEGSFRVRGFEA